MRKKVLMVSLAAAFALSALGCEQEPDDGPEERVLRGSLEESLAWLGTSGNPRDGSTYTIELTANATSGSFRLGTSGNWRPDDGVREIPIYGRNNSGPFIRLTLILTGGGSEKTITFTSTSEDGMAGIFFNIGGRFILDKNITLVNGGVSSENSVYGGDVEMRAGAKIIGGGVFADNFTMSGGEISGNTNGSGVSVYSNGTLTGGEIHGNGSGVSSSGNFTMTGGKIYGNRCGVSSSSTFTMKGGEIYDNEASSTSSAYGGGVYVHNGSIFTMSGGQIYNNKVISTSSFAYGGGVYANSGSIFTMSGGQIYNNTAKGNTSSAGGGVYLRKSSDGSGKFTKTGGEIYGNKVKTTADADQTARGHAAAIMTATYTLEKKRDADAGASINLDSTTATNWE